MIPFSEGLGAKSQPGKVLGELYHEESGNASVSQQRVGLGSDSDKPIVS